MFFDVVDVAADGVVATFVVAKANPAIPNNFILVDNNKVAIPAAIDVKDKEEDIVFLGVGISKSAGNSFQKNRGSTTTAVEIMLSKQSVQEPELSRLLLLCCWQPWQRE